MTHFNQNLFTIFYITERRREKQVIFLDLYEKLFLC